MEARLIEEETERCVSEAVEARVKEVMASQAVQQSLQERLVTERKLLEEQVHHSLLLTALLDVCTCSMLLAARCKLSAKWSSQSAAFCTLAHLHSLMSVAATLARTSMTTEAQSTVGDTYHSLQCSVQYSWWRF